AAQPRSGLAPMMPTRILLAPPLLITITPYRPSTTWSPLRSRRSALGDGLHVFASPDFGGQRLHGLGKVCPDLVVGQLAFLEAGVSMRHGQLEIEYPRAERGKDFAELGLCPGRPKRASARTNHGHRFVPQHVLRARGRDPVGRL